MPVSPSAKRAVRVAARRKIENIARRGAYKDALKGVKKAVVAGAENIPALLSLAQSTLDRAAKSKTIHPNKAARLKSRLSKRIRKAEQA